uniref:Uncharacterized protein n=1 Tax=Arundo donax TaxID=35708 RepID=A0A0A9HXS5_ARUDO
MPMEVRRKEI